ncbi:MAG: CBS domain-containing protein [Proteobacteria bacterium]|nr:CBS domain-containing protein [Pseudomonadota bacterium]
MGEMSISREQCERQRRRFMRAVLNDLNALEIMNENGMIESGITRIGAEQEMFLVDKNYSPASKAIEILEDITDPRFTFEIAKFNLEANLTPSELTGDCLRKLEKEINETLMIAKSAAAKYGAQIVLAGILPTLKQIDLTLDNMVPIDRYFELNETLKNLRGADFRLNIRGMDELSVTHDSYMLEALNTSFQVHLQVSSEDFVHKYNIAQAITAPIMAAAVNSGLIHHNRLWHESRIAVFQNSVDTRSDTFQQRGNLPRVYFGKEYIKSLCDLFREDISRFPVVLTTEFDEDPVGMLEQGIIPKLKALMLHNGTVYRWNRPCYGVVDNVPHLRIENRVLPSGPSVIDEVANTAFFVGLMMGMSSKYEDITQVLRFADVANNFLNATRIGLESKFHWIDHKVITSSKLILDELLPIAHDGLIKEGLAIEDINRYLGVITERSKTKKTGAKWAIKSITEMDDKILPDEKVRSITSAMVANQKTDAPVHTWKLAEVAKHIDWRATYLRLGQFMTEELFTVRPDDLLDLAASIMDWKHVRHVPVEDDNGHIIGLISHRAILREVAKGRSNRDDPCAVKDVMTTNPITAAPDTLTVEAIRLMRKNKLGCLPVVEKGKLVGLITDHDLINVAGRLLEEYLEQYEED